MSDARITQVSVAFAAAKKDIHPERLADLLTNLSRLEDWLEANEWGDVKAASRREDGYFSAVQDVTNILLGIDDEEPFITYRDFELGAS